MNKIGFFVPDILTFCISYESFKIHNNDDDYDEFFLLRSALFPAGSIVRGPHHRESPTRRQQGLNLSRA